MKIEFYADKRLSYRNLISGDLCTMHVQGYYERHMPNIRN